MRGMSSGAGSDTAAPGESIAEAEGAPGPRRRPSRSLAVLVVDDEPDIIEIIAIFLEPRGYEVAGAGDADQGRALALSGSFDVVLCDQRLPGTRGLELCRELRDRGVAAKLVIMTGLDESRVREDPLASACDAFLIKPFAGRDLEALFDAVLPG